MCFNSVGIVCHEFWWFRLFLVVLDLWLLSGFSVFTCLVRWVSVFWVIEVAGSVWSSVAVVVI